MLSYLRNLLLYGCLLYCVNSATAQTGNVSVITYIAEIPIIIETGIYIDTLSAEKILNTVSGKIRLALAPRKTVIESDQYFQVGKPVHSKQLPNIEYRYFINDSANAQWLPLPLQDGSALKFPYAGLLADTLLRSKEKLVTQFRLKKEQKIIQQNIVSRDELSPSIFSYRQKDRYDAVDSKLKSMAIGGSKRPLGGFDTLKQSQLVVSPGKHLEFLLSKLSLNKDSCIQYRLQEMNKKEEADWRLTGHLLTLNSIRPNSTYLLHVKYLDMDAFNTYQIITLPFWHQTSWAMAVFVVSGAILLLGLPYSFYRYRVQKERQTRMQVQEQLKTVQSQLNPHFVYNALSSIEGLVTNKENERANEYLSSFSEIMRDTLKNSGLLFISLAQDIEMLERYIAIEQLRFEFRYAIAIDPQLDLDVIEFPPMLLQPCVENAVKHGVSGLRNKGMISIAFRKKATDLEITITDNGKYQTNKTREGHGYGIKFTTERIKGLLKLYKQEKIDYSLLHTEEGTTATFFFKNWIA